MKRHFFGTLSILQIVMLTLLCGCSASTQTTGRGETTSMYTAASLAVQDEAYLAPLAAELEKTYPRNRTINLVCHGHSVPTGYTQTPTVNRLDSYPHLLFIGLCERYPTAVVNVITTSIGGENSVEGARRFERDVLSHRPSMITIDYALNDRRLGLERSERAWRSMIESALAHDIPVILLTPTGDTRSDMQDPNDPLNQHAEQIRRLAAEYKVGLVDSLAVYQEYVANGGELQDLMSSVNHPSRRGHELVAEALMQWFPEP